MEAKNALEELKEGFKEEESFYKDLVQYFDIKIDEKSIQLVRNSLDYTSICSIVIRNKKASFEHNRKDLEMLYTTDDSDELKIITENKDICLMIANLCNNLNARETW